ncbi:MAG TPA: EutP/PduV family microcompartment system protein [Patescibacteria group bacterium]|nr:EutP/PduV family microcompartment system protein [Patescibacteria group bacterium]
MKRIMFVGPVGVGKTSLICALKGQGQIARKTQAIGFEGEMIDTPGEYTQIPRFYSALQVTATEAAVVVLVQAAVTGLPMIPPGFVNIFHRPVIGVINKIDLPQADPEWAMAQMRNAGVTQQVFLVSAATGQGLAELYQHIREYGKQQ